MLYDLDLRPEGLENTAFRGNCGVVATAVVLDRPYPEIENEFRLLCNKSGRWRGSTRHGDRLKVITRYNKTLEKVNIGKRGAVKNILPSLDPNRKYIVRTGGHAMAYVRGCLVDQSGTFIPTGTRRGRRIVDYVHEVVENVYSEGERIDNLLNYWRT